MFFYIKNLMIFSAIFIIGLNGCGGSSNNTSTANGDKSTSIINGIAQLGNLANANVTIYKIEDNGTVTPLWNEITSSGTTLNEIGKFKLHIDNLNDNTFYLYKVKGGKDWDANDTGVMDTNYTINRGIIRSIAKGSDIKIAANNFSVSYATELLYEKVAIALKRNFNKTTFQALLNNETTQIIKDINGDNVIDMQDILTFNPVNDKNRLTDDITKLKLEEIIHAIHNGKTPILSNISNILSSYNTAGYAFNVTLSNDGKKAYVADDTNGLVIINVSDPANPTLLGSYDTTGGARAVTLSNDGKKAYVADRNDGLVIIDVSDPTNPTLLGSYNTAGDAFDVILSNDGTKAYVSDYTNGLVIIDVSDSANPTLLGSYDTAGGALASTLSSDGTKAYVSDYTNGLVIIDVSDPTNPTLLGSYDTAGNANGIILSNDGTKAYIADDTDGLVIIDVSDSTNPTLLGSYDTNYHAAKVTLSNDGTKAYVGDNGDGVIVIDVSNSFSPTLVSSYDTVGNARGIILSNDGTKIYVADDNDGLVIIDLTLFD
ncbi:Inosine-5'-monophosphate dehydrogenase [hydrothermal vent metagenome]|uniref:Inosine-5'-monophosphate dehydrogenase n=1 Tax=hydrothermal vent metagenome TaxID=652676 RepID=A0A1W1D1Y8_9ZZZZ